MVESTALEMRRARKGTVGSNPTLSATESSDFENRAGIPARTSHFGAIPKLSGTTETPFTALSNGFLGRFIRVVLAWYRSDVGGKVVGKKRVRRLCHSECTIR